MNITVGDFDYQLPQEQIAQVPVSPRDTAKLLIVDRTYKTLEHRQFSDLAQMLDEGDVLVINQSKVFPARLLGKKATGGGVEVLLLSERADGVWEALSKPGLTEGAELDFGEKLAAKVVAANNEEGVLKLKFSVMGDRLQKLIDKIGLTPLPPYIHSPLPENKLKQEYQNVYAAEWGSAAAPTAGMHFTRASLKKLADNGVGIVPVTLHVGLGTFAPVTNKQLDTGTLHVERFCLTRQTAEQILRAKRNGKRVIAVGTTSARVLESAAEVNDGELTFKTDWQETGIFIKPPYRFKVVDSLVTNFHLPKSSLLMLVTAMVTKPNTEDDFMGFGKSLMGEAYRVAVAQKYRFYSFGDAMWIK